jgi:hypothetical protein
MTPERLDELDFPLEGVGLTPRRVKRPFCVSIDARAGTSTGFLRRIAHAPSLPRWIRRQRREISSGPGHVFR